MSVSLSGLAQQQAQYSMYRFNPLSYNPAYAGSRDALSITVLGRKQWVRLDGAPTTGTLSVHSPLKNEKINVGLSFSYDEIGSTKNTSVYGDIAYRTKINSKTRLSFGVKGGFEAAKKLTDATKVFSLLANIGDTKSLIIHPASTTHQQLTAEQQDAAGVGQDLIRLSVGLEDIEDLKTDLENAFAAIDKSVAV